LTALSLLRRELGQGMAEYVLMLSLVAILAAMFVTGQGDRVLATIGGSL
jgi:hypothetical protein